MLFSMTRPTESLQVRQFIVIPISVFMVNNQESSRFTAFTGILAKTSVGLNTTFPHRIIITRVIEIFSITSIVAKSRTIFRRTLERSKIALGFVISNTTKSAYKFNNRSFVVRNLSLNKWSSTHTNSVSPNVRRVNGSKKFAAIAAGKKKK